MLKETLFSTSPGLYFPGVSLADMKGRLKLPNRTFVRTEWHRILMTE